ncbi:hypothetical protein EYF80_050189 [Liparis tanakae]|uniref:Isoamyl acetate-hydrolyzing esterase 1 n=1 Tax=Liparis tanakae TaxID=230148 RepID=A0A4Z2FH01_9TELE|nr:hypothetical protein EYF80_050189 [Liparis tanakae]
MQLYSRSTAGSEHAICLMAPSNNLTSSRTIASARADFRKLLLTVSDYCSNVFVLDFTPRLNIDGNWQDAMRQEFHSESALMGVKYYSMADFFKFDRLHLWAKDGIHLSDNHGMKILVELLWQHSYEVEAATPVVEMCYQDAPTSVEMITALEEVCTE